MSRLAQDRINAPIARLDINASVCLPSRCVYSLRWLRLYVRSHAYAALPDESVSVLLELKRSGKLTRIGGRLGRLNVPGPGPHVEGTSTSGPTKPAVMPNHDVQHFRYASVGCGQVLGVVKSELVWWSLEDLGSCHRMLSRGARGFEAFLLTAMSSNSRALR